MFLSRMEIDSGTSGGRAWLANPYRVHQRLSMAFPSGYGGRVLFRIENDREPARVIVQSQTPADWERAFHRFAPISSSPIQKEIRLQFRPGQRLRFFLRANPTARRGGGGEGGQDRAPGKRLGLLREADQRAWLIRKGEAGGFRPGLFEVRPGGVLSFPRGADEQDGRQAHLSVDFEGYLEVIDPTPLAETVANGIGTAKGFGFGLLSLAPA